MQDTLLITLNSEETALISKEEAALKTTIESLSKQRSDDIARLATESSRARALTSELVKSRRVEEKALLASDEAVAHSLAHKKNKDIKTIERMLDKPYFARFEVEEELNGDTRRIEYKLGFAANSDCRIMDWRKAPISKLFYEYQEGDTYSEEIQGREREGVIVLRHNLEIEKRALKKIVSSRASYIFQEGNWRRSSRSGGAQEHHASGGLPHILSLITPEQFKLISEAAQTPLLIQGIAGSGKTSVAIHRLAYLLHEDNSELLPEQCVFLVLSPTLRSYVADTLPRIGVEGVPVLTFSQWASAQLASEYSWLKFSEGQALRPLENLPLSCERLFSSMALLHRLETSIEPGSDCRQSILNILSDTRALLAQDESKLLDQELIKLSLKHLEACMADGVLPRVCEGVFLRASQLKRKAQGNFPALAGALGHIAVDEIQDMSPIELACILAAAKSASDVTLVGDTAQGIEASSSFPGWEKLRKFWGLKDSITRFVSLQVTHRNTREIMRLAEHVLARKTSQSTRSGRIPIYFRMQSESNALASAIGWLNQALQRYPEALTCVITPNAAQAQELYKLLRPQFGSALRLGSQSSFSFEQGIVISDLTQIKGLEFVNVLVWGVDQKNYGSDQSSQRRLYLAITRASENLCLISFAQASNLLPKHASTLLRIVDQEQ